MSIKPFPKGKKSNPKSNPTSSKWQVSKGVAKVNVQKDGSRQHAFTEGTAAHVLNKKGVRAFSKAKYDKGDSFAKLHMKNKKTAQSSHQGY